MSWRPSNDPRPSYASPRAARAGASTLDPTTRTLIIAAVLVGLISIGTIIALTIARSQGSSPATTQPVPAAPAAALTPVATVAPTAIATTTAASAPLIVSARGTPTPAPTVSPAEAGPLQNTGDAVAGQALFTSMPAEAVLVGAVACSTCHNVDPGSGTLIGPSLSGVATRAETRVAALSAAQYIRTSITAPNSYVVESFVPGIMTQTFGKALTPTQIEDLVAYLLTLK
ncbi:MAG: c-type cytochrome [Chloroflexales bacterium]